MLIKRMISAIWLPAVTAVVYLFLYLPILILIIFSFNKLGSSYEWTGFTCAWYKELFYSYELMQVCKNSFLVATLAAVLTVSLSLLFVYYGSLSGLLKAESLFYTTVALPDIMIAIGLLSFFVMFQVKLGFVTLIVGHTLLGLGFVVPLLSARIKALDKHLTEAALDLGATQTQIFFTIIIPILMPSLLAALLLVFMISLDDFLVAFFCSDSTTQTLSLYVFSLIRSGASSLVNALSAIILLISSIAVLAYVYMLTQEDES